MKQKLPLVIASSLFLLSACSTNMEMKATGGSKSDGTVTLSFDHATILDPIIDEKKALQTAQSKCKVWGFRNAKAFGGSTKKCLEEYKTGGCVAYRVKKVYQCY